MMAEGDGARPSPRLATVLPHEPLPPPSAGPGRINLQGALVPQAKGASDGGERKVQSADAIAEKLCRSLRPLLAATCGDALPSDYSEGDFPGGLAVEVHSESKASVVLPSQSLARTLAARLRRGGYSPRDLLASTVSSDGNIKLVDEGSCPDGGGRYAGRALQVTHVAPSPGGRDPDDESDRWGRAAPPKFLRLVPNPSSRKLAMTAGEIEERRRTTRFVRVDSVLGPDLRADDVGLDFPGEIDADAASVLRRELSATLRGRPRGRPADGVTRNGAVVDDCRVEDDLRHSFADGLRAALDGYDTSGRGIEVFLRPDMDAGGRAKPRSKKGGAADKAEKAGRDGPVGRPVYDHLHLGMRSNADATRLVECLQGRRLEIRMAVPPSFLRAVSLPPDLGAVASVTTGALYVDHADVIHPRRNGTANRKTDEKVRGEPSKSECTSSTSGAVVPGLRVVRDHVTAVEEGAMLAALTGPHAPWAPGQATRSGGVISRRVQHYGYVFDYETSDVLRRDDAEGDADGADGEGGSGDAGREEERRKHMCPPLPRIGPDADVSSMSDGDVESWTRRAASEARGWEAVAGVIERTRRTDLSAVPDVGADPSGGGGGDGGEEARGTLTHPHLNQMTVNEYTPGQGIGGHVDTRTAFGDGLLIVTLGGGTVMEFREVDGPGRKLVHLPPRSLALLSGDARYRYEHMIVSRMTDTVDGEIIPRRLRVSLTLRTALTRPEFDPDDRSPFSLRRSVAPQSPLGRVETCDFPPRWGQPPDGGRGRTADGMEGASGRGSDLVTPETERVHVHNVYDAIATQWHHTRGKRGVLWPGATAFLGGLEAGSVVADVGCGDGKYFAPILERGCYVLGTDISEPLLRTAAASSGGGGEDVRDPGGDGGGGPGTRVDGPQYDTLPPSKRPLASHPATAVADCLHLPLRSSSVDAAICIAVMHHLSTEGRRLRCLSELRRVVRKGGLVNVQAWALEQDGNERRRFHGTDVLVPFKAQPKYLGAGGDGGPNPADPTGGGAARSIASRHDGAEYDSERNLVVFQRYCHMYRRGELEELVGRVDGLEVVGSSFERGNHVVTLRVVDDDPRDI